MGKCNPFVRSGAIRYPSLFFEQPTVTRRAVEMLQSRQCVSVIGPPRIGKSSLLRYLERRLEHGVEQGEEAGAERYCCVFIECHSLGTASPEQCVQIVHERLAQHLNEMGRADVLPQPPATPSYFMNLPAALGSVRRHGLQAVLIFDNFESLGQNPLLDKSFFDNLRAVNSEQHVQYVTASSRPLDKITYAKAESKTSEFFSIFAPPIRLGLLSDTEATRLLTEFARHCSVEFPGELTSQLVELVGPHPRLLQIAGYHALEYLTDGDRAGTQDPVAACLDAVRAPILDDVDRVWEDLWKHAIPENEERYYLALLALKQDEQNEVVKRLQQACVVRKQNGRLVPLSGAFRRFVARQEIPPLIQAWPVVLDPQERIVLLRDEEITLTESAFRLLECLAKQADHLVTYEHITDHVRRDDAVRDYTDRGWLKPVKGELKRKLNEKHKDDGERVQVKEGVGYRFVPETD